MRCTLQQQCQCDHIKQTEMDEDTRQLPGRQETLKTFYSENLKFTDVLEDKETVCFRRVRKFAKSDY
jgi:hypothetical protein